MPERCLTCHSPRPNQIRSVVMENGVYHDHCPDSFHNTPTEEPSDEVHGARVRAPQLLTRIRTRLAQDGYLMPDPQLDALQEDIDTLTRAAERVEAAETIARHEMRRADEAERTVPDVDEVARFFHDEYEDAAITTGWQTQEASRVPWDELPEANRETMRIAVSALIDRYIRGGE